MNKVYAFTNENLSSYHKIYHFNNAKVLSVLGSGDQYFSSLLYGAKDIELYDINEYTWDYFVLKFYAIANLTYEEFYDYFLIKKLSDYHYFTKLKGFLPTDITYRLDNLYQVYGNLSYFIKYVEIFNIDYNDGHIIPYLNKDNYLKLQNILKNIELPTFYHEDLLTLPDKLTNKSYDLILTSNIFYWINLGVGLNRVINYKNILEKFNYQNIQALYSWTLTKETYDHFKNNGFAIARVPSAKKLKKTKDYVISLRK